MQAEIHLPYHKQGDDIDSYAAQLRPSEALAAYGRALTSGADQLSQIAKEIGGHKVEITGDTHFIQIDGPDVLIRRLLDNDLVCRCAWMAEEEDWDGEELDSGEANDCWAADEELRPRPQSDSPDSKVVASRQAVKAWKAAVALAPARRPERWENESL